MIQRSLLLGTLSLSLLLAGCGRVAKPVASTAPDAPAATIEPVRDDVTVARAQPDTGAFAPLSPQDLGQASPALLSELSRAALGQGYVPQGPSLSAQSLPDNALVNKVAMKVLILSSGPGDFGIAQAQAMLQEAGVPYTVLDASQEALTMDRLVGPAGVGRYQGVILTSSNLLMAPDAAGLVPSALDSTEWATLFEYEKAFRVRQVALYGSPGTVPEDYGLRSVPGAETSTTVLRPTTAGRSVFNDLTGNPIDVRYAYTYPSQVVPVSGVTTTPLLTDANGRVLAATSVADGRERLILTSAQSPYLRHSQFLSYGLVKWLTKGVHLGEHRRFLQVDIDDWFQSGAHYNPSTGGLYDKEFRISGYDALSVADQQSEIRWNYPVARDFRYAIAFNGGGASRDAGTLCTSLLLGLARDSLTSVSKCQTDTFDWVNHTKDHIRMDVMDYPTANSQIGQNFAIAQQLGLKVSRKSLVTGEHSGLGNMDPTDSGPDDETLNKVDLGLGRSNPNMLQAASANGVRYIASDHSVRSQWDQSCLTCGVPHPLNPGVFLVPRWPNGVAYHVTTPAEATAFYNSIYGPQGKFPYWPKNFTYSEFLNNESDIALNHVLDGGAFPHYMHQPNLRQYTYGKSLASDWIRALLDKYSKYSTLPLTTLPWDDLGAYLEKRTTEEKAKAAGTVSAVYDQSLGTVAITTTDGVVPVTVTGSNAGSPYGAYRSQQVMVSGRVIVDVTSR